MCWAPAACRGLQRAGWGRADAAARICCSTLVCCVSTNLLLLASVCPVSVAAACVAIRLATYSPSAQEKSREQLFVRCAARLGLAACWQRSPHPNPAIRWQAPRHRHPTLLSNTRSHRCGAE